MKATLVRATLAGALVVTMVASLANADVYRYRQSGNWTDITDGSSPGWGLNPNNNGSPGIGLPGAADQARINWGNNTVTVDTEVPMADRVMIGVDESGIVVVESGGVLSANNVLAGNNNANATGTLTVNDGGTVNVSNILWAANNKADGIININSGAVVNVASHLWWGVSGTAEINISGTLHQTGGILGLGTSNASTPGGGQATVHLLDGGLLALNNISGEAGLPSIQTGSLIDITGGELTLPGDFTATLSNYVSAGKIIGYGGDGTVNVVLDDTDPSNVFTKATASEGLPAPAMVVWDPASNPSGTGLWSEDANWSGGGGQGPGSTTEVVFNKPGAIPCQVASLANAGRIVMGDTGPGGTLIVTNGASLNVGDTDLSVIGDSDTGTLLVDGGGSVSFAGALQIGLNSGSDGALTINDGAVSVAGEFTLGSWFDGVGTVHINGGVLNLAQLGFTAIQSASSVLDIAGSGKVVIMGDATGEVDFYVGQGQITANGGSNVFYAYDSGDDTTTVAAEYVPPARSVWDPALNPSSDGSWSDAANWSDGLPGDTTKTVFNVPDAMTCVVSTANASAGLLRMGDNGPGGTLVITNGGSLTVGGSEWSSINYNDPETTTMVVEDGGVARFGNHLWIGHLSDAKGELIMNGGEVFVGEMFGLGWNFSGGTGTALIKGGTLNLHNLHATKSITGDSVLDVSGTGLVLIDGNKDAAVADYVAGGFITSDGGPNVIHYYDVATDKTVITTVLPPRNITEIRVADGNVTLTYDTFGGHTYHVESTSSLVPPIEWTLVPGTTTNATANSVTTTFPAGAATETFYRTVSP